MILLRSQETNNKSIEQKRVDYYTRQTEIEKRRAELDAIQAKFEAERRRREEMKEDKRVKVKVQNDRIVQERVNMYLNRIELSEKRLAKAREKHSMELLRKSNFDFMKEQDRTDNIMRMHEVQEYRRQKLLEKIEKDNERTRFIQTEQQNLMKMRLKMRDEMSARKQQLLEDFEKRKKKRFRFTTQSFSTRNFRVNRKFSYRDHWLIIIPLLESSDDILKSRTPHGVDLSGNMSEIK